MAIVKGQSTPTLVVNNVSVPYVGGTLSFTEGTPEKKVRTQTGGGGTVQRVWTSDETTRFSDIKFQLLNTDDNIEMAKEWVNNDFNNSVSMTDSSGFTRYGSNAGITNKYEVTTGIDGKIDIEFQCDALS
jgi:hypothetical protein